MFSCEHCEIFEVQAFFNRTPLAASSVTASSKLQKHLTARLRILKAL